MPRATQHLIDIAASGTLRAGAIWPAWAVLVGVYLGASLVRNLGFRFFWNRWPRTTWRR